MAELTKKLNLQKTGSSTVSCKIYSTADEAGDNYMRCTADGVNGYIALGSTSDANATVGRVSKSGTTYAIKSQAAIPYNEQSWTTAGTYSWVAPSGVKKVRVALCGGGGGAGLMAGATTGTKTGTSGGLSRFGTYTVQGGGGGTAQMGTFKTSWERPSGGTTTTTHYTAYKGSAGVGGRNGTLARGRSVPTGYTFDSFSSGGSYGGKTDKTEGTASGGAGYALSFTATTGSYGQGGSGTADRTTTSYNYGYSRSGGGSGYFDSVYIDVMPGSSYEIIVGAAGTTATGTGSYGSAQADNAQTSGFVLIAYGGDIK